MKRVGVSVAGLMALVAVLAVDIAALAALRHVMELTARISLFAALVAGNILAAVLVAAADRLTRRGEVTLSQAIFLIWGGATTLAVLFVGLLAPGAFYDYVDLTSGPLQTLWLSAAQRAVIAGGTAMPPVQSFGMGGIHPVAAAILVLTVVVPMLTPACLASWATRGFCLKLERASRPGADGEAGPA